MKSLKSFFASAIIILAATSCGDSDEPGSKDESPAKTWHTEWFDDFNGNQLDANTWVRTERGTSDWNNNQSPDPRLVELRDGCVVLRGMVNDDKTTDPQDYICGGICTKGKKALGSTQHPSSVQVRARLGKGAQGAWPAIWMMPFQSTEGWPACGEIDLMERLSSQTVYYSTVHSHYITTLGNHNPANSMSRTFTPGDFHVFEVQLWPDRVEFYLDYKLTLTYPKVNDGADNQFPFFKEWYLIMDMQLGGSWVGPVSPAQLPVEMEVDWVKYQVFK